MCLNLDMWYISEVYKATYVAIVKCIKLNILLQSKVSYVASVKLNIFQQSNV